MSLTVRQLTDDGAPLLTFAPSFAPAKHKLKFPGTFSILIDPWLQGTVTHLHPKFAGTCPTTSPAVASLADIEDEVDLIIISQSKADHLHRETLCTLPADSKITILATPKAAKLIRSWRHFQDPNIIQVLRPYSVKRPYHVVRIPIEPYSSGSAEGEVTVTNIVQKKKNVIGLHNAIAITYCPPGSLFIAQDGTKVKMTDLPMMSLSPSESISRTTSLLAPQLQNLFKKRNRPNSLDGSEWTIPNSQSGALDEDDDVTAKSQPTLEYIDSPLRRASTDIPWTPSTKPRPKRQNNRENVSSVIYTPHGIDGASLYPYIAAHLSHLRGALPVTALFHSITVESNPWWMGGVICTGAPGGVAIATDVGVKYWLGAHGEVKESRGLATKFLKSTNFDRQEVVKMLREAHGPGKNDGIGTEVVVLHAGEQRRLAV